MEKIDKSPLGLLYVYVQPHLCDTWLCPAKKEAQASLAACWISIFAVEKILPGSSDLPLFCNAPVCSIPTGVALLCANHLWDRGDCAQFGGNKKQPPLFVICCSCGNSASPDPLQYSVFAFQAATILAFSRENTCLSASEGMAASSLHLMFHCTWLCLAQAMA